MVTTAACWPVLDAGYSVPFQRASGRTKGSGRQNYPPELAELSLIDNVRTLPYRAYQRNDLLDKRRQIMAEWNKAVFGQLALEANAFPLRNGDVWIRYPENKAFRPVGPNEQISTVVLRVNKNATTGIHKGLIEITPQLRPVL